LRILLFIIAAALIFAGCNPAPAAYYELPVEFRFPAKKTEFISKYSPFLKGKKIFIDPGHGGSDRRNKGRLGIVTEADANLRVALALRDILLQAGAFVEMSRTKDTTVDLKYRSTLANKSGADIFISIHHNAPASAEDNWTNYTSTYYHARENDYAFEPCSGDLARYVQRDVSYAMRNPGGPGSFDGTYSDFSIYPGEGFSVLRNTKIPAILVECGYHTNQNEERRLAVEEFNRIEAWGIFRGIARYFSSGIPVIIPADENEVYYEGDLSLSFLLRDSAGIKPGTVEVWCDSVRVSNNSVTESPGRVFITLPGIKAGRHIIRVVVENKNNNHSFPYSKEIIVKKK
jgi:N-acetylmuramoyl-L-alanine amidase